MTQTRTRADVMGAIKRREKSAQKKTHLMLQEDYEWLISELEYLREHSEELELELELAQYDFDHRPQVSLVQNKYGTSNEWLKQISKNPFTWHSTNEGEYKL